MSVITIGEGDGVITTKEGDGKDVTEDEGDGAGTTGTIGCRIENISTYIIIEGQVTK